MALVDCWSEEYSCLIWFRLCQLCLGKSRDGKTDLSGQLHKVVLQLLLALWAYTRSSILAVSAVSGLSNHRHVSLMSVVSAVESGTCGPSLANGVSLGRVGLCL
jgi:hypothetical protein